MTARMLLDRWLGWPLWAKALSVVVVVVPVWLMFRSTPIWAMVGGSWLTWKWVVRHGGRPTWTVVELPGAGTRVHRRHPIHLVLLWLTFTGVWGVCLGVLGSRVNVSLLGAAGSVGVVAGVTFRDLSRGRSRVEAENAAHLLDRLGDAAAGVVPGCRPEQLRIWPRWNGKPTSYEALGSFVLDLPAHAPVDDPSLPDRLAGRLGHWLPWPAVSVQRRGPARFEVAPARKPVLPDQVWFPLDLPATPGRIPFGVDPDGQLVAWTFMTSSPHALIAGRSGFGKSYLLADIALAAALNGYPTVVLDPKRTRVLDDCLSDHPGVWRVTDEAQIASVLDAVERLGQDRSRRLEARQIRMDELSEVIVICDEFSLLVSHLRRAHRRAGGKGEAEDVDRVTDMVLSLREFKLHLCLATQRPDTKKVSGDMREQMGGRVLLGPSSSEFTQMMGFPGLNTDHPGRGVTQDGVEFQAWLCDANRASLIPSTADDPRLLLRPFLTESPRESGSVEPARTVTEPLTEPMPPVTEPSPNLLEPSQNRPEPVYDVPTDEAARLLGCSDRMITKHVEAGRLHRIKRGRSYFYNRAELDQHTHHNNPEENPS